MNEEETNLLEKPLICPVCSGENPPDTVFCRNLACRKALGEFAYIEEEFATIGRWYERVADKVTDFVGKPHFVLFHGVWFIIWSVTLHCHGVIDHAFLISDRLKPVG